MFLRVFFALSLFNFSAFGETTDVNVGITALHLEDINRLSWDGKNKRPITTHLFYPTYDETVDLIKIGNPGEELFIAGTARWNAKPVNNKKIPLIIMSHGTGGSALQMLWLAEKLVKKGYFVAGVNHHGNTAIEKKKYAEGFVLWWERAKDLAIVLQQLNENKEWSPYIDQNNVGVIGFSLGGYTAISSIGGITDKSLFDQFCLSSKRDFTCDEQIEFTGINAEFSKIKKSDVVQNSLKKEHDSYKIEKFKAALVISPALAQSFTENSLREISIPVSVIVGTNDKIAPAESNAKRIAALVKNSAYNEIKNTGHYTFLSECTKLGKKYLAELCYDSNAIERNEIHEKTSDLVVDFFNSKFNHQK